MRKTTFRITLALLGMFSLAPGAFAGESSGESPKCDICVVSIPKTHPRPCKVKVCTEVIDRCTQTCEAQGPCGKIYLYTVTQITYKDVYSDGTTRIWKSSI